MSTPYAVVSAVAPVMVARKGALIGLTRQIEAVALDTRPRCVAATLQDARYLTPLTRSVYARLGSLGVRSRLHARGLQAWVAPGVEGVDLAEEDPLVDEWVVVVPGPSPVAFAATDLHDTDCEDALRSFSYAVTHDPAAVAEAARLLGV